MKNKSKPGFLLLLVIAVLSSVNGYSQLEELGKFMAAGPADAEALLQPYVTPVVNGFGAALGGGWYNTAETHKLGGFDLTFTGNVAFIPDKYSTFLISNNDLSALQLADPLHNVSQTVSGEDLAGPEMVYNVKDDADNVVYTQPAFTMPGGLNLGYAPSPMIQVGIGLIKGTEVMVRYIPNLKYSGNELGLWGIGGKHDIGQWIPGLKKLPVLKLAVMYGYTKLHTFVGINVTPDDINAGGFTGADQSAWDNQEMKMITQSHTANLLISANLPVVCFYGGIGFVTTKTNLKLEGDFPGVGLAADNVTPVVVKYTNPIDMEIKNQDGGFTKPRFNAGVRFKLSVVTIHVDYSWANYSVLTAGLGISVR
jgi:hypothetical protein